MKRAILIILLLPISLLGMNLDINTEHLEFLRDEFDFDGGTIGYWIYADKLPDGTYKHVDAPGEGATCIDDVARVAIYYLRELDKNREDVFLQKRAKEALDFILKLQTGDGDFYNFIFADGTINKNGPTSRLGGNWWAARSLWALGLGARSFSSIDAQYSLVLSTSAHKTVNLLDRYLVDDLLHGYSDMSSVMLLGIAELSKIENSSDLVTRTRKIAKAIETKMQSDGLTSGLFDEGKEKFDWHGWGSRQIEALVAAYEVTGEQEFLDFAEVSVKKSAALLVTAGPLYNMDNKLALYPQIAYGLESYTNSVISLYRITDKPEYAKLAAIASSWLIGMNKVNDSLVGPGGQGYDGLEITHINKNAGAESTICSLLALQGLENIHDEFRDYFTGKNEILTPFILLEAEKLRLGLSEAEVHMVNNASGNAELSITGSSALREKMTFPGIVYEVYGSISSVKTDGNADISLKLGKNMTSKSVSLFANSIVYLGELTGTGKEDTFTLGVKLPDGISFNLDQLIFLPQTVAVYNPNKNSTLIFDWRSDSENTPNDFIEEMGKAINIERAKVVIDGGEPVILRNVDNHQVIDFENLYNNDGTAGLSNRLEGNFDNLEGSFGAVYPHEEIEKALEEEYLFAEGIPFYIKLNGNNNFRLTGQTVELNATASKISFLGASDHGNYIEKIMLVYKNGSTYEINLGFSDWCGTPATGEKVALELPYRYEGNGNMQRLACRIYLQSYNIPEGELSAIIFPDKVTMHIFAVTLSN